MIKNNYNGFNLVETLKHVEKRLEAIEKQLGSYTFHWNDGFVDAGDPYGLSEYTEQSAVIEPKVPTQEEADAIKAQPI